MSVEIVSGASVDKWTIDPTSKAGRVTLYDAAGNALLGAARVITGVYSFSLNDVAGATGTANNYLSLLNPAGSGIQIALLRADYNAYAVAATIAKSSMRLSRISAATVGTTSTAYTKHKGTMASALGIIRTGNPTVTLVADIKGFPPPVCITAVGCMSSPEIDLNPRDEREQFHFAEGEGCCFNHAVVAQNANSTFNIRLMWMEFTGTF